MEKIEKAIKALEEARDFIKTDVETELELISLDSINITLKYLSDLRKAYNE